MTPTQVTLCDVANTLYINPLLLFHNNRVLDDHGCWVNLAEHWHVARDLGPCNDFYQM